MASINGGAAAPLLGAHDGGAEEGKSGGGHVGVEEATLQRELKLIEGTNVKTGLSDAEFHHRLAEYGYNELAEKKENPCLKFLMYFWGPMPIMIWLAVIIELIKAISVGSGWEDFAVLLVLQFLNGIVGYIEEKNAGNAIAALKEQLAPQCFVKRDGEWRRGPARELVPGDLIQLKLGDVIPADAILLGSGMESLDVDQAALTGESLPVCIYHHEKVKMGSAVKRGEMEAVVCATGSNTFFGRAATMIGQVESTGRFQKILFRITLGLLALSAVLCVIIFIKLVVGSSSSSAVFKPNANKWLRAISIVVVLLVASIPIAMQVVCTSTMAVGSRRLADKKVIVARLSAIEELAGMTVLCSDKTGTLTQNKLTLRPPIIMADMDERQLFFYSALSAKRVKGNQDAIDYCICEKVYSYGQDQARRFDAFEELDFHPFNPTDKRTEATILSPEVVDAQTGQKNRHIFQVTKGAPQVVLRMCLNDPKSRYTEEQKAELNARVSSSIQELADRGFRALGVAMKYSQGAIDTENLDNNTYDGWEFQGLLSLFDPPRTDTKATVAAAVEGRVEVKMITGDQTAIAKETCRQLGMGTNILDSEVLHNKTLSADQLDDIIMESNGFAEVMPEDKFDIVNAIRKKGYVVGMTGDGVNDAPALKRADIGIAVEGATDAAKAAADIVLTEPGLSVIIDAIQRSRKIFQRMRNYCIYRIACTVELLLFFFFAIVTIDPSDSHFYGANPQRDSPYTPPEECTDLYDAGDAIKCQSCSAHQEAFVLPVIALVIITILNDGTIITIAYDKVIPEKRPQAWDLREVTVVSTALGAVACIGSIVLLVVFMEANCNNGASWAGRIFGTGSNPYIHFGEVQTLIYLKISISDFLTVFSARTRWFFFARRPGYALACALVVATSGSTLFALFWPVAFKDKDAEPQFKDVAFMAPLSGSKYGVLMTWVFSLCNFVAQDLVKVGVYWVLSHFDKEMEARLAELQRRAVTGGAAYDESRAARRLDGYKREGSLLGGSRHTDETKALVDRLAKLEAEMAALKKASAAGAASS